MIEGEKRDFMKSKILVYILNSDNISCDKRRTTYNPVSVTVNSTPFNSSSPSRTINLSQSNDTMSAFNHFSQQNLFIILFFLISRLFLNLVFLLLQVLHFIQVTSLQVLFLLLFPHMPLLFLRFPHSFKDLICIH